jgi:hypothetical protein
MHLEGLNVCNEYSVVIRGAPPDLLIPQIQKLAALADSGSSRRKHL